MAYIGRQLARGENKLFDDISSSFNGSTTVFNLTVSSVATATATPYQLFVSLGGVMQKPNTDFTTAGNQITFTTAPAAGLSCWIMMQGDTIDQAAIPDSSVTPSKIAGSGDFAFPADVRLKDGDGSNYVGFQAPTTVASNVVWTLPAADSSGSKFLKSNGSGVLSWDTPATIGGATGVDFNDNVKARWGTDNDLEIFCNNSNSIINDAGVGDLLFQVGGSTKATVSSTGLGVTGALTVSTNATITGNLTVNGTTTTVDSVTLSVKDKNIEMGVVSSPSDTTADGGGITLKGASDKTLNWVNATDAWTSSEHIHLLDGKKLFVGGTSGTTDGIEIHHTSNNSFINDSGTGTLQLQLGGSTKLEVTSGGINVTGAINVNGAALSTAPTITGTASGSLTANRAVIVKSDGTLKQPAITPDSAGSRTTVYNNSTQTMRFKSIKISDDKYVIGYIISITLYIRVVTISGTSCTLGTAVQGGNIYDQKSWDMDWSGTHLLVCRQGSSQGYMYYKRLSISGTSLSFVGSDVLVNNSGRMGNINVNFNKDRQKFVIFYRRDQTGQFVMRGADSDGSNWYGPQNIWSSNTNQNGYTVRYHEGLATHVIFYVEGNSSDQGKIGVAYLDSSNNIQHPTELNVETSTLNHRVGMAFDTSGSNNTVKLCYCTGASGGRTYIRSYTITKDQTPAADGGKTTLENNYVYGQNVEYDSVQDRLIVNYSDAGDSYKNTTLTMNTDFSSITTTITDTTGATSDPRVSSYSHTSASSTGLIAYVSDSGEPGWVKAFKMSSTDLTANNYVGYSSAGYTNGQTATVNVLGNTTTQSSLTPGTTYYVQGDGSVSATAAKPSVEAGKAISSTKILLKN